MKKGFTILELIGVISLIATLSIIITISVDKTIENSKHKTNMTTIQELVTIIKTDKIDNMIFTSINATINNGLVTYTYNGNTHEVSYMGKGINNGLININENGLYEIIYIEVNNYCYSKELNGDIIYNKEYNTRCSSLNG